MTRYYIVTYSTLVAIDDSLIPVNELKKTIIDKAISQINASRAVTPSNILEIKEASYETVSEDKTGESKVPGNIHRGPQPDNGMGSSGKQESSEDRKEVQGHEQGSGERNNAGQTGTAGKAS